MHHQTSENMLGKAYCHVCLSHNTLYSNPAPHMLVTKKCLFVSIDQFYLQDFGDQMFQKFKRFISVIPFGWIDAYFFLL